MNGRKYLTTIAIALVVLGTLLYVGIKAGSNYLNRRVDEESAIETTLEWGKLAAFPESARNLKVTSEGSMFTRAFRITFRAPMEDIEDWIESSPGLRGTEPEIIGKSTKKYLIKPGGGAEYAEVVIETRGNGTTGLVKVHTYWS